MDFFFTADPHFGHENIIKHCSRPFATVEEMDETMIANWNKAVGKRDTVRLLGDFAYRCTPAYAYSVLQRLNGKIHIVLGNHDALALNIAKYHPGAWASVTTLDEIKIQKQKIVLSHYAMRSWHHDLRGAWHLYGHTHGLLSDFGKSFDIGVDVWGFKPISFEQVKRSMDKLTIGPHPGSAGYTPEVDSD